MFSCPQDEVEPMSTLNAVTTDQETKRQRIEHLIELGDQLIIVQQKRPSQTDCSSCTSSSRDTSKSSVLVVRRSSWTPEEDEQLRKLVQQFGQKNWSKIASHFPTRDRKRCRERFVNHLVASSTWSSQDDKKLLQLQRKMNCRWTQISKEFRGKSGESVKNRCLLLARRATKAANKNRNEDTKAPPQQWTPDEKKKLTSLVHTHGAKNWLFIASQLPERTDLQCLQQWYRTLDDQVMKGKGTWTQSEDQILVEKVAEIGKKWSKIAAFLPGRIGTQCRERFLNHLDPSIEKRGMWKNEYEEVALTKAVEKHSTQWHLIAKELPRRRVNAIKNHWYSRERQSMLTSLSSSAPATCDGQPK